MSRRLIDARVGEYRYNFFTVLFYGLMIVFGCAMLFFLPVIKEQVGENLVGYGPIKYLLDERFANDNMVSYLMLAYVIYYAALFLNYFLSLGITKLRRSAYFRVTRVIGFVLGLMLISFHTYLLLANKINADLYWYFRYQILVTVTIWSEMLVYYHTKKISIYD